MVFFKSRYTVNLAWVLSLVSLLAASRISEARVSVIATTEHEALIAKEIGGDFIDLRWVAGADINPQRMDPPPGWGGYFEKADLLLVNGQGLEAGWLPALLKEGKNGKIMPGAERYIMLSEGVNLLPYESPEVENSRFQEILLENGIHQEVKNHHYWLDPENTIPMAQNIARGLAKADPSNSKFYQANGEAMVARLKEKIREWDAMMIPFKGKKIVAYHRSWTYLARRHGLEIAGYLEPKELNRPGSADFRSYANQFKDRGISAIILSGTERPPFVDVDSVTDLGVKIHARTIILPESMNPSEKRGDVVSYFDYIYRALVAILK